MGYAERKEQSPQGNVPNLRFPEFSGEWEKFRNDSLFNVVSEKNKGKQITSVLSASQTDGMVSRDSLGIDIKFEEDSIKNYKIVREGDYVIHLRSFQGGFAFSDRVGVCSPAYTILRPTQQISYGFLKPFFMSNKFIDSLRLVTYGIRDGKSISVEEWLKLSTSLPSVEEQKKISAFLSLLDERIAAQIKIIEDLKKLKSAISNEIFEHTSNRKCELKEIASVIMGQSPSSHAYNHNAVGLPLIQGNLDIENGQLSPRIYTSEITQTCECGDVILTVRAPVGEIAIAQQEACIGRGVCSIRPHVKNDTNLIYQFLQYFRPKWGSLEQGSTFTAVSGTDIRGVAVSIPSTDKIELLNVYDNKIRVESRILTNLTQQKQYLLAQMFI